MFTRILVFVLLAAAAEAKWVRVEGARIVEEFKAKPTLHSSLMAQLQEVTDDTAVGSVKRGDVWVSPATQAAEHAQQQQVIIAVKARAVAKLAVKYRAILRAHYGDGAEVNREITVSKVTADMLDADDAVWKPKDILILTRGFEVLCKVTGTDETWTFPWALIPE